MIVAVSTQDAPKAIGPYSQAVKMGDLLFVSGQIPIVPEAGDILSDDPVEQAEQCLKNIAAIAKAAGTDIAKTVKTTVLLTDLGAFARINEVYATYFSAPFPARACYEVKALPKGAKVEIEAIIALA